MKSGKKTRNFKDILWSYDLKRFDAEKSVKTVVVQTVNYGDWRHWALLVAEYGKDRIRHIIENTPSSEFRPSALALAMVVFRIKKIKYASRSSYIRSKKTVSKT